MVESYNFRIAGPDDWCVNETSNSSEYCSTNQRYFLRQGKLLKINMFLKVLELYNETYGHAPSHSMDVF